jgi:hypothetical protein
MQVSSHFYQLATLTPTTTEKKAGWILKLFSLSSDNEKNPCFCLELKFSHPICGHHFTDSYIPSLTYTAPHSWTGKTGQGIHKEFWCRCIQENIRLQDRKGEYRWTLAWILETQVMKTEGGWKWLRIAYNAWILLPQRYAVICT